MSILSKVRECQLRASNLIKKFFLPLYGRKMIIAIFATVLYLLGVPWDHLKDGANWVVDNNKFFIDSGMWFYAILATFMGGQMIDQLTNKDDDHTRAGEMSTLDYLKLKTKEILEPRQFMIWILVAIMFALGIVDDEIFAYVSFGYVGMNSGQALLEHFRSLKSSLTGAAQSIAADINQQVGDVAPSSGN